MACYEKVVNTIRELPSEFRPIYFSFSDRVQSMENRIDNLQKFDDFFERSKRISTCLIGEKITFDLNPGSFRDEMLQPTHGYLYVYIKRGFKHIDRLPVLLHLLIEGSQAPFGYISESAEWESRNYLEKEWKNPKDHAGASSISFPVGIDFRHYLTGLYWYTVFEDKYIRDRGVLPNEIAKITLEYDQKKTRDGRNLHCYKFFEKSNSWQEHAGRLDDFCRDNENFFSLLRLTCAINAANTKADLDDALSFYRM